MISTIHPRIWLSPERLAQCKARAAANDPRWTNLKNICENYLLPGNPYGEPSINLALAYQITKDARYATRAIELARPLAMAGTFALTNAVNGVGQASPAAYNIRLVLLILSIVYDWCADAFTAADLTLFTNALRADVDFIWGDTNPVRLHAYGTEDPGDNFYHAALMGSWLGHLALGDEAGVLRDKNRWLNEALPYFAKYQAKGFILEGTSYGCESLFRIWFYLDAHLTATGEDLTAGWPLTAARLLPQLTTPTMDRIVPAGDQAREKEGLIADPTRAGALIAQHHEANSGLTGWLSMVIPNRQMWVWDSWQEMVWGLDFVAAPPLPPLAIQHNAGTISRTSWQKDATVLYTFAGPGRQSHQDRSMGSFMLFKGDWLVGKAGLWGGNGILRETLYHNTVLVPPFDQPEFAPAEKVIQDLIGPVHDSPSVQAFADTADYSYTRMELAGAYAFYKFEDDPLKRVHRPLTSYLREILWLKPDQVLVFDRITAADPTQELVWALQTKTQPVGLPTSYGIPGLTGQSLLPAQAVLQTAVVPQGPNGATSSWRTEIRPKTRTADTRFLQILSTKTSPAFTKLLPVEGAEFVVEVDSAVVIAMPTLPLTVSTAAARFFVTGLTAGKVYQLAGLSATASPEGVATFAVPGAGTVRAVTLSTGGIITPPPPALAFLSLSPHICEAGAVVILTATLTAPPVGITFAVALKASSSFLPVPAFLTVPPGATSAIVIFTAGSPEIDTQVTVTGIAAGVTKTDTALVKAKVIAPPGVQITGAIVSPDLQSPVTGHSYTLVGDDRCWKVTLTDVKGGKS